MHNIIIILFGGSCKYQRQASTCHLQEGARFLTVYSSILGTPAQRLSHPEQGTQMLTRVWYFSSHLCLQVSGMYCTELEKPFLISVSVNLF